MPMAALLWEVMRCKDGSLQPEILGTVIEDLRYNLIPLYHHYTVYHYQHLTCCPSPKYNLRIG